MKKQLLVAFVGTLMLLSLAQVSMLNVAAVRSPQTSQLKVAGMNERNVIPSSAITDNGAARGNNYNAAHRAGAIPTQLIALAPNATTSTVHVGDKLTFHGKLIRTDTGAGIPGATIRTEGSFDNETWYDLGPEWNTTTDSKGEDYGTITVPDPRPAIKLPITIFMKFTYDGNSTYAATSAIVSITVLPPPSKATTTTIQVVTQAPKRIFL